MKRTSASIDGCPVRNENIWWVIKTKKGGNNMKTSATIPITVQKRICILNPRQYMEH